MSTHLSSISQLGDVVHISPEFISFARAKLDETMLAVIDEFYSRIKN